MQQKSKATRTSSAELVEHNGHIVMSLPDWVVEKYDVREGDRPVAYFGPDGFVDVQFKKRWLSRLKNLMLGRRG